eukprot:jgi/Ulvmu1/1580/UM111_0008.1
MSNLVLKLTMTFVRQLSKPIAQSLTGYVMGKPALRKNIVHVARRLHAFNVWLAHYGENKKVIIGEMVEDKAVTLASTMVSESFIYAVAAGFVYYEYQRNVHASDEKKEQERQRHEQLVQAAEVQREMLRKQNMEQFAALGALADRVERLEKAAEEREGRRSFWRRTTSGSAAQQLAPEPR